MLFKPNKNELESLLENIHKITVKLEASEVIEGQEML